MSKQRPSLDDEATVQELIMALRAYCGEQCTAEDVARELAEMLGCSYPLVLQLVQWVFEHTNEAQ